MAGFYSAVDTWNANRNISAKEPKKYLSERIEGTGVNEDSLRARLGTHLIPYDEFVAGDYGEFCKARSKLMYAKMLAVCETISTPNPD
ncbi:MAG: hypothetical protein COB08_018615 [Rhodobacteraceae bacterium]|nr:hypothetical protein [Paracoccaceae bacterium]